MQHRNNLVVHASDLPKGRGWSPLTWQILEGKDKIPVTIFEAEESVDSGPIYEKSFVSFSGNELIEELRCGLANIIADLCRDFVSGYPDSAKLGLEQEGEPSFYPHRGPEDSKIDVQKSLLSQFHLLRTVDNNKYPAWFEYKGRKFFLKITAKSNLDNAKE